MFLADLIPFEKRIKTPGMPALEVRIFENEIRAILSEERKELKSLSERVLARRRIGLELLAEMERQYPNPGSSQKENREG